MGLTIPATGANNHSCHHPHFDIEQYLERRSSIPTQITPKPWLSHNQPKRRITTLGQFFEFISSIGHLSVCLGSKNLSRNDQSR